ncbi:amino acid adenylation domain-containing protein [Streptomyces sp. NPDC052052]|uniref:amino acid adenylation domain-containing protein n=1 Tax=Streptomyces sp. NPDC052052 TaxID=3154756 RepID=UPI00343F353B
MSISHEAPAGPMARRPSLEAALPLAPLQEGMLFHALYDDDGLDVYTIQVAFALRGPLSVPALRRAVDTVVGRYASLRAGFRLRKSGAPVQLVRRDVTVPWTELDLRGLPAPEQRERLIRHRAEDRARGFDMATPPLIRMTLARLADEEHVLVMTYHHILLDAWSFQIVCDDLFTRYAHDGEPDEPVRVVPFERYLAWLGRQDRQAARDAWAAALDGLEEPSLVAAGATGPDRAALPRLLTAELPEETTERLVAAARRSGLTLNTVVQTVWALVLSGLTGRQDVVFGQTVSGRPAELEDVESIVGLFINAAPVRVRLDPEESLDALLGRVQREQADLEPYHHLGLTEIQRSAGLGDLFDTAIAFASAPQDWDATTVHGGLRVGLADDGTEDQPEGWTHYPLNLSVQPGRTLRMALSHRADLFDDAEAGRIMARVRKLFLTYLDAPAIPVGRVGLLTGEEWTRVIREWNDTGQPVPATTLPAMFQAQVARTPDATAVVFGEHAVTYAEFAHRVTELTAVLRGRGVGAGDFVAVAVPRSVELVVALHAVVAAGAAYVPVDPDYPAERIGLLLEDAAAGLLLTTRAVADRLPPGPLPRLHLDEPLPAGGDGGPAAQPSVHDPAYVIFTSGSTGRPKGVVVNHAAITNRLLWMQDRYPIGPGSRVLQKTPSGFDVSVWEFFWPLHTGATLVVAEPGGHKDAAYLTGLIRRERVTDAHFVPSMLQVFLQEPDVSACTSLRRVFASGEALPQETEKLFFERLGATLHNLYGPTEAAVDVTSWDCEPGGTGPVPIGRPVWNTRTYVLDPALRPVAPGAPGELYLSGRQLADGYLGRPGLTAERFVADPFDDEGRRMYRTGDVVRHTRDGNLEYLGRADDQVKIRGQRVELGEIESALAGHPSVAHAAVVVREDQPGTQRLVAYVVSAGAPAGTPELLEHAARSLPEYMVPAALVQLPELPLTPNGKLDRKALPAPVQARAEGGRPARGPVEECIAACFAEVLGVSEVGASESFFELGGDSIISIQLVARARRAGLVFTAKDVFTHRTVAALARVARPVEEHSAPCHDDGTGELPAMPITHWLRTLEGTSDAFHQATLVRVPPAAAPGQAAAAAQALLDRHDALRMRRTARDGAWALRIDPCGQVRSEDCVRRVPVEGLDAAGLRAAVAAAAERAVGELRPDDGHMVRFVWFDAGAREPGRLLLVAHHLVVDGVSWRILLPDLRTAWEAAGRGETPVLDPVPTSLRTWGRRLAEAATDPARVAELPYWQQVVRPGAEVALTGRSLDPARDVFGTARSLTLRLAPEDTEPLLTTVPAAYRAGVDDVLLTALALAVGAWRRTRGHGSGSGLVVDLEGHGREEIADDLDLSRTVGWFTSLYPVRIDPGPAESGHLDATGADAALKRVKEQLRAVPGHGLGHGMLRHLNPVTGPVLAPLPVPQIGFNYLGRFAGSADGDWEPAAESDVLPLGADPGLAMPHALEITAVAEDLPSGPSLAASLTWPDALFSEADMSELGEAWLTALRALVAHGARPGAGGLTPSDVLPVVLGQEELQKLESAQGPAGLTDVLPLTPVQEGLFFHHHYDRRAVDVYHVQLVVEIEGDVRAERLRAACQALADRHPALRAAFVQTANGTPVQLVPGSVHVPWQEADPWDGGRGGEAETRRRLTTFLDEDRRRGFDLETAPLMRFTLLRTGPDTHALVFTSHHLLADGWSVSLITQDLFTRWTQQDTGPVQEPTARVRPYYEWLAAQDTAAAEDAWRGALDGLTGPTLVAPDAGPEALPTLPERVVEELPEELTAAVAARARACGLTLNTVVQGAWALALHRLTGRRDVVFGVTVSVRPPELPGVEEMVGLLLSTVPLRVRLEPADTLAALLGRVQNEQIALAPHAHLGPAAVQRIAGLGPLYDTSMVFENFPRTVDTSPLPTSAPRITGFSGRDAYHYPLKLMAVPGDRLFLEITHRAEIVPVARAREALTHLRTALAAFAADPGTPLDRLLGSAPEPAVSEPALPAALPAGTPACPAWLPALVADVLGVTGVGPDDDFFQRGGDSLRALRLAGRVRTETGIRLDVREIYLGRTVAGIADRIARQAESVSGPVVF